MCFSSYVGDFARDYLPKKYDWLPAVQPTLPYRPIVVPSGGSQADFDALRAEVRELKELLLAAKKFDAATGQRDCEQAEKIAMLKSIAKIVGVDLSDALS